MGEADGGPNDGVVPLSGPECAAFYLPGLAHQLGNLLLTVQGNALHMQHDDLERAREALLEAVSRGGASLAVLRAWTGEDSSAPGDAVDLLRRLLELGRGSAREKGITLALEEPADATAWVPTDAFVRLCSEALWRIVTRVPAGTEGVVTITVQLDDSQRTSIRMRFAPADGSLPFPVEFGPIASALAADRELPEICAGVTSTSDALTLTLTPSPNTARAPS